MKNIDHIKNMSTKEMAIMLAYFSTCDHCVNSEDDCIKKVIAKEIDCEEGIAKWLESERTETELY